MKRKLIALLIAAMTLCTVTLPASAALTASPQKPASSASVRSTVPAKKKKLYIKEVDYDRRDKELEIEFSRRVQYRNPKVIVRNAKGKALKVKILDKERDEIEVRVKGMKLGRRYTVKVSGVRAGKSGKFITVSRKFIAVDH